MKSSVAVLRLKRLLLVCPFCLCGEKSVIRCRPSSFIVHPSSFPQGSGSEVNHSMLEWCALQHQCKAPMCGTFQSSYLLQLCWPGPIT